MNKLTFAALRKANTLRLPTFRNAKGELSHNPNDGHHDEWTLNDWCTAVTGELGEAANILKKVRRGDMTLDEARPALSKEIADVQIYLDLLAKAAGIDLGEATINKFNEVSLRVLSPIGISPQGEVFDIGTDTAVRDMRGRQL